MYSFLRKRLDRFTKHKHNYEIELIKSSADIWYGTNTSAFINC